MDATVECIAVHGVTTDRLYLPGETVMLSAEDADALEAAGAVKRAPTPKRDPKPKPESSSPRTADGPVDNAGSGTVTAVKGIGPKTEKQLAALGIETLADLASISSEEDLARVAGAIDVIGDELEAVTRWRDEARALVEAEASGE